MICLLQAIVDRNPAVSSAALVSSIHLMKKAGDVSFYLRNIYLTISYYALY